MASTEGPTAGSTGDGAWNTVARILRDRGGVDVVFGLPDDDQEALVAAAAHGLRFVVCRDQRNALFAATGYALQSGSIGVAVIGRGPAVTNALTGLLEARECGAPVLLLASGTPARSRGRGAFQELDQIAVVRPLVGHAERVDHLSRLAPAVLRALLVASARPGPVYLEVPDGLTGEPAREPHIDVERATAPVSHASPDAWGMVRGACRPLIMVGGGMRHRNTDRIVEALAELIDAPISCTASGRGVVNEDHPQFVGLAGLYMPSPARPLWLRTDCVLSLGSRLEETATSGWPPAVGTTTPVVQVNTEVADLATTFAGCGVQGDAAAVVRSWLAGSPVASTSEHDRRAGWRSEVRQVRQALLATTHPSVDRTVGADRVDVCALLRCLQEVVPSTRVLVQENGLNDMWSYFYPRYSCGAEGGSVVPSDQTSLGFGAAAAIGVKIAAGARPVVALVGDGAFGMLGNDLLTAVEQAPGLLYVVLDNGGYGWLERTLRQHPARPGNVQFAAEHRIGRWYSSSPEVATVSVDGPAALLAGVVEAWEHCRRGSTAVLTVPVDLSDAPLAMPATDDAVMVP